MPGGRRRWRRRRTDPRVAPGPARFGPWRRELRSFLELFALAGIAVAQPTLDLLNKNSELLVSLRATKLETVALALIVVVVPPVALWLLEVVVGLVVPPARRYAHALIAGAIVAVFAFELLKNQLDLVPATSLTVRGVVAALVAGAVAAFLVVRYEAARTFLRFLAIAPLIFAFMFIISPEVQTAVFEGGPPPAEVAVGKPNRLVMIVMDELPVESLLDGTGHIDATLFPNFAALAADSTWYRNNTTVAGRTHHAVPAILTGDSPTDRATPAVASEHPHSLFTLLGDTYDMNVHEPVTHLCPSNICGSQREGRHGLGPLLDQSYDLWRDFVLPSDDANTITFNASFLTEASTTAARGFARSLEPDDGPRLDFLHILLPHQPWHLRPSLQDDHEQRLSTTTTVNSWPDEWTALAGRQRHLLQLQATDRLLGEIFSRLKRIGAYDESTIVLTADHGVAFDVGSPMRNLGPTTWPEIMFTPLVIKSSQQATGRIDDRPVNSIDLLPTIADELDIDLPWKVDGRSALRRPVEDGPRKFFARTEVSLDGPTGFAAVLGARATSATGDPALRLYRLGEYGDLVGRRARDLVVDEPDAPTGTIRNRDRFADVKPDAVDIPWAFVEGTVRPAAVGLPIAVTVNGVVAATVQTVADRPDRAAFWASLPPQLFTRGRNDVRIYAISDDPASPRLTPIATSR